MLFRFSGLMEWKAYIGLLQPLRFIAESGRTCPKPKARIECLAVLQPDEDEDLSCRKKCLKEPNFCFKLGHTTSGT